MDSTPMSETDWTSTGTSSTCGSIIISTPITSSALSTHMKTTVAGHHRPVLQVGPAATTERLAGRPDYSRHHWCRHSLQVSSTNFGSDTKNPLYSVRRLFMWEEIRMARG